MWLFVRLGREEIVEMLVKHGADVNRKNKNGKSALDIAVEKGKFVVFKIKLNQTESFLD